MKTHERYAKEGYVWVCTACGKVSPRDLYGDELSDNWWDESCVLNAIMVREDCLVRDKNGNVVELKLEAAENRNDT